MNLRPTFDPSLIKRPAPQLLTYYIIIAVLTLPAIFITLPLMWLRYATLQYSFDKDGISMRWGILFRREILLTYRRIQDIHLTKNILQRWLGLATVSIQTASGSATPEMSIEGILEAEELRDYLYKQMRGAKGQLDPSEDEAAKESHEDETTLLLQQIRDNLAKLVTIQETPA